MARVLLNRLWGNLSRSEKSYEHCIVLVCCVRLHYTVSYIFLLSNKSAEIAARIIKVPITFSRNVFLA